MTMRVIIVAYPPAVRRYIIILVTVGMLSLRSFANISRNK